MMTNRFGLSKLRAMSAYRVIVLSAASALAAGCGVSEQEYAASQRALHRAQERLSKAQERAQHAESTAGDEHRQCATAYARVAEIEDAMREAGAAGVDGAAVRKAAAEGVRMKKIERQQSSERDQLAAGLREQIEEGTVRLEQRDGMLRLVLPDEGLFTGSTINYAPTARKVLDAVSRELVRLPARRLLVGGHTDGAIRGNFALAVGRARLVAESLVRNGVESGRLAIAGFAEYDPIADLTTDDGRARNRRTEIVLIPAPDFVPPSADTKPARLPASKPDKPTTTVNDDPGLTP